MAHLKFSLRGQCHKTTILSIVFKNENAYCSLESSDDQSVQAHVNTAWIQQGLVVQSTDRI